MSLPLYCFFSLFNTYLEFPNIFFSIPLKNLKFRNIIVDAIFAIILRNLGKSWRFSSDIFWVYGENRNNLSNFKKAKKKIPRILIRETQCRHLTRNLSIYWSSGVIGSFWLVQGSIWKTYRQINVMKKILDVEDIIQNVEYLLKGITLFYSTLNYKIIRLDFWYASKHQKH